MSIKLKENLNKLVKERGLTLTTLAKKAGIPKSSLHGWMSSNTIEKINVKQLQKVCSALEIPMYSLLFAEPDPHEKRELGAEVLKELFSGDLRVSIHKIERK